MKLLVCYRVNARSQKMAGVFKKMLGQLNGFSHAFDDVYALYMNLNRQVLCHYNDGNLVEIKNWNPIAIAGEQKRFWENAGNAISHIDVDAVYARYDQMYESPALTMFMSKAYRKGIVTGIEFPTYPYEKEILNASKLASDNRHRSDLHEVTMHAFSTCAAENIINIPNQMFNNKVDLRRIPFERQAAHYYCSNVALEMITVANISFWHGIDRVIEGLRDFKRKYDIESVKYHIVGEGNALSQLREQVDKYGLNQVVDFHGFLDGKSLSALLHRAHVGIAGIGLHRKHIQVNSALKVREYLANGLPVIMSTEDPDLEGFTAKLRVSADDSPLDIQGIKQFALELSDQSEYREAIRHFAERHLSWCAHGINVASAYKESARAVRC